MVGVDVGREPPDASTRQPIAHRLGRFGRVAAALPRAPHYPCQIGGLPPHRGLQIADSPAIEAKDPVVPGFEIPGTAG